MSYHTNAQSIIGDFFPKIFPLTGKQYRLADIVFEDFDKMYSLYSFYYINKKMERNDSRAETQCTVRPIIAKSVNEILYQENFLVKCNNSSFVI